MRVASKGWVGNNAYTSLHLSKFGVIFSFPERTNQHLSWVVYRLYMTSSSIINFQPCNSAAVYVIGRILQQSVLVNAALLTVSKSDYTPSLEGLSFRVNIFHPACSSKWDEYCIHVDIPMNCKIVHKKALTAARKAGLKATKFSTVEGCFRNNWRGMLILI